MMSCQFGGWKQVKTENERNDKHISSSYSRVINTFYIKGENVISKMSDMNISGKFWCSCPLHNAQYVMLSNIPTQMYYINVIVGLTCNVLLIISGIILNSATILAYWKSAPLRKKMSYFLIMLLSLSDLTVAVVGHLVFVLSLAFTLLANPNCTIRSLHEILTFATVAMSLGTLLALNIERYFCIVHPFFHCTKMTKLRLLGLAAVFWLYACLLTLSYPILGNRVAGLMTSCTMFTIIVVTVCIYISICCAVCRPASNPSQVNSNTIKISQNLRTAKSCAIVVACTVICFLPYAIVRSLKRSAFKTMFMDMWAKTLTLLSSSLNSLVLFWRNPILRKEAKAVLKDRKRFTRRIARISPLYEESFQQNIQ